MGRRGVLAAAGTGLAAALAGCLGGVTGGPQAGTTDRLRLESLDVGGSPGGPVTIRPPGKVVLLDFFATWCAPCKPEMANLRAVRARFDPASVFVVSITSETDEAAIARFWRRYEGTWPVVMDPGLEATRAYDVTGVPTILVLEPDGTEVMRHVGLAGEDKLISRVEAALDTAASG